MLYKNWFLAALLVASFLPAVVSVLNFEILNQSVAAITFLFSLLAIMSGAHVWLTLAYYANREWLEHFQKFPMIFFLSPVLILIGSIGIVSQPDKSLGISFVYGVTFINLWHHSKQNWGILSMVGKIRSQNVTQFRLPLIYAWPFFLMAWCLQLPELSRSIGPTHLKEASIICSVAYLAFSARFAWRSFLLMKDPFTIAFGSVLICYFMPLILLVGKPYALLIWASAHALQYYVMVLISMSMKRRSEMSFSTGSLAAAGSLAILIAFTVASWLSSRAGAGDFWSSLTARFIVGTVTGINLVHFWIDAFIWKFSSADIRQQHGEAFTF